MTNTTTFSQLPGRIRYKKLAVLLFLILTLGAACTEDENIRPSSSDAQVRAQSVSPASFIAQSEKLFIPAEVDLPPNLPNGNTRVATHYAQGVQKYRAQQKAGSDPVAYEWVFVAPRADLYDKTNKKVGTHYAGPTWKLLTTAQDSINAQHFLPARTAKSPDASSIDWLFLMPKTGTIPTGIFKNVAYIQRIATTGGKAPSTPPTSADETIEVPYTAVYRFTKINP